MSSIVGNIEVVSEVAYVKWKIHNFLMVERSHKGMALESKRFSAVGCKWSLRLLPEGLSNELELCLLERDFQDYGSHTFTFTFEIKKDDGTLIEESGVALIKREGMRWFLTYIGPFQESELKTFETLIITGCMKRAQTPTTPEAAGSNFQEVKGQQTKLVGDDPVPVASGLLSLSRDLGSLLESGRVSDVQLKTKGDIRSAHRSVLAARSEVFSAMFLSDMKESNSGTVDISDADGEIMDLFLQYLYTGKFPSSLDGNILTELYAVGDKYAVQSLKKLCCDRMTRQVSEDNYQELLVLADSHSDEYFKDKVIHFVLDNPKWLDCEKWFNFSKQHSVLANEVYRKFCDKTYFKKI